MWVACLTKLAGDGLSETNLEILLVIDSIVVLKESETQNPLLPAVQGGDLDIAVLLVPSIRLVKRGSWYSVVLATDVESQLRQLVVKISFTLTIHLHVLVLPAGADLVKSLHESLEE